MNPPPEWENPDLRPPDAPALAELAAPERAAALEVPPPEGILARFGPPPPEGFPLEVWHWPHTYGDGLYGTGTYGDLIPAEAQVGVGVPVPRPPEFVYVPEVYGPPVGVGLTARERTAVRVKALSNAIRFQKSQKGAA